MRYVIGAVLVVAATGVVFVGVGVFLSALETFHRVFGRLDE